MIIALYSFLLKGCIELQLVFMPFRFQFSFLGQLPIQKWTSWSCPRRKIESEMAWNKLYLCFWAESCKGRWSWQSSRNPRSTFQSSFLQLSEKGPFNSENRIGKVEVHNLTVQSSELKVFWVESCTGWTMRKVGIHDLPYKVHWHQCCARTAFCKTIDRICSKALKRLTLWMGCWN